MQRKALRYDKAGDQHYDYISAWIKSTRGSDPDASLYYLAAMLEGGEDARFIARRMVILASEDVGNADPQALQVAVAAAHAVEHVGLPECTFALAQAAIYLSLAPKSHAAGKALGAARAHIREHGAGAPAGRSALGRVPGGAGARARARLRLPARSPRARQRPGAPACGRRESAVLRPRRRRARAARTARRDPPVARAGRVSVAEATRGAQPLWSLVPVSARARYIRRAAVAMLDELDDLALLLADETGRPRTDIVLTELLPAARGLRELADDGPRALADKRVWSLTGRRTRLVQAPVGLIGLRGPSASPWAEPALETAAALLAGNGVLLGVPAHRLRNVFLRAGVPGELVAMSKEFDGAHVIDLPRPDRRGTLLVLPGAPQAKVVEAAVGASFVAGRIVAVAGATPGLINALSARADTRHRSGQRGRSAVRLTAAWPRARRRRGAGHGVRDRADRRPGARRPDLDLGAGRRQRRAHRAPAAITDNLDRSPRPTADTGRGAGRAARVCAAIGVARGMGAGVAGRRPDGNRRTAVRARIAPLAGDARARSERTARAVRAGAPPHRPHRLHTPLAWTQGPLVLEYQHAEVGPQRRDVERRQGRD